MKQELVEFEKFIHEVRGQKVMLDLDLAAFYDFSTKRLNETVKRNSVRFTKELMFRLSVQELGKLSLNKTYAQHFTHGGQRHLPNAFTEYGAIVVAQIINTPKAFSINTAIVRAFVRNARFPAMEPVDFV